jgi:hypothetical protein
MAAFDLPDGQSQVIGVGLEATSFRSGLDADKPASPAAGDIWLARDTYKLYCCMVAGAWMDIGYWRADVTQVQPTRAVNTVYQNTGGKIRVVTIWVISTAGNTNVYGYVLCDSSNPPTTEIAAGQCAAIATDYSRASMTFVVPPLYWYKLTLNPGSLYKWTEYDLL